MLNEKYLKDSSDYHINLFLFKYYYAVDDFQNAFKFQNKLITDFNFQPNWMQSSRFAVVCKQLDMHKESNYFIKRFENLVNSKKNQNYEEIRCRLRLHCLNNNTSEALNQLRLLSQQKYFYSNNVRLINVEPIFDPIRNHPDFDKIYSEIEKKFKDQKEQIRKSMLAKGLM